MKLLSVAVLLHVLFVQVNCYRHFQLRIPNGEFVKHPCIKGHLWHGVGHKRTEGGGERNQFGLDFYGKGTTWTEELCRMDSDGDGLTNGEELGDPNCTWTPASQTIPPEGAVFTHPGICDPFDSPKCKNYNKWVSCEFNTFECDAINDPDVINMTARLPLMQVPAVRTSHYCVTVKFPEDRDYHLIAADNILNATEVMHHVALFGCPNGNPPHPSGEPFFCDSTMSDLGTCTDYLTAWFIGATGTCLHDNNGFRVGPGGYQYAIMQVHWENIEMVEGIWDNSGLLMYLTPNLRQNDAGVFLVGQEGLEIPPGLPSYTEMGGCSSECTAKNLKEDIYLTFGLNHMHYLGRSMNIQIYRQGNLLNTITNDSVFYYDSYNNYRYNEPIRVQPGDEIRVNCTYKSTSRDATTIYGIGYLGEMCYGFLTYYPKQAMRVPHCYYWKELDWCSLNLDQSVDGCDVSAIHDITNSNTRFLYERVMHFCRPYGPCYDECLEVIKDVKKNPCYHGDVHEYGEWLISKNETTVEKRLQFQPFYAALMSCDVRLAQKETVVTGNGGRLSQQWLPVLLTAYVIVVMGKLAVLQ